MRKFIITEIEKKHILNMYITENKNQHLIEVDIYDDPPSAIQVELDSLKTDLSEYGITIDTSTPQSTVDSLDELNVCSIGDNFDTYISNNFAEKIKSKINNPNEFDSVVKTIVSYVISFIDQISKLSWKELKNVLRGLKQGITTAEAKVGQISENKILKEFFGTGMALVTIFGSFTMPALVLTIVSVLLVTLVGLWLLKTLFCAFNISVTSKKRCRVRSFEWGQCK